MTAYGQPIAYTYEADTHCVPCTLRRFPPREFEHWPPEDARDGEGHPLGAIAPWDEWHEQPEGTGVQRFTLVCGTCGDVVDECVHGEHEQPADNECTCDSCLASKVPAPVPVHDHVDDEALRHETCPGCIAASRGLPHEFLTVPVGHPGPARGTDCYTSHPWGAQWDCGCDVLPSGRPPCTTCGRAWDDHEHSIFGMVVDGEFRPTSPTFHGYHEPERVR